MDEGFPKDQRSNGLVVPWGWLSLILTVLAISALGTLAVIAKGEGADTLSTIALALAVLSFSAQLIVALAQAFNGTQQVAQADKVNADTRTSLAAIRATSEALLANQREQFNEVLHVVLKFAVPAAVRDVEAGADEDGGASEVTQETIANLEERLSVRINEAFIAIRNQSSRTPPNDGPVIDNQLATKMTTYPNDKRGRELTKILNRLDSRAAALFIVTASRSLRYAERLGGGKPTSYISRDSPDDLARLEENDLITAKHGRTRGDRPVTTVRLTDLGVELAGLVLGGGPEPRWLKESNTDT